MKVIMYIVSKAMNFYESHEDHMHSYQMTTFTTLPGKTLIRIHPPPLSSLLYSLLSTQLKLFILHRFTRVNLFYFGLHRRPKKLHAVSTAPYSQDSYYESNESTLTLISSVFVVFMQYCHISASINHEAHRTTLATEKK